MKVKALQSFTGVLTMQKGKIADCDDEVVVRDLLEAGYVELVETNNKPDTESAEESQEGESEAESAEESQDDESAEVAPAQPKASKKGVKKSEGK